MATPHLLRAETAHLAGNCFRDLGGDLRARVETLGAGIDSLRAQLLGGRA